MKNFLPFLALFAAIGIFFGYVQPSYSGTISVLKQQLSDENDALSAANKYVSRAASLDAESSQISSVAIANASIALPDSASTVQLIFNLSALASRSGFFLTNFSTSNMSRNQNKSLMKKYRITNISISGTGTYHAFRQFLDSVEYSLRLIDVKNLSIKNYSSAGKHGSGIYSYQITLQTYWLPK